MTHVQKDTAVLLKEKGFDLNTYDCYIGEEQSIDKTYREYRNHNTSPIRYSAPTLYEATEWLREKGGHVYVKANWSTQEWFGVISIYAKTQYTSNFPTHDLALEAGIVHALKNYVK
jgi:hypothetical protein